MTVLFLVLLWLGVTMPRIVHKPRTYQECAICGRRLVQNVGVHKREGDLWVCRKDICTVLFERFRQFLIYMVMYPQLLPTDTSLKPYDGVIYTTPQALTKAIYEREAQFRFRYFR